MVSIEDFVAPWLGPAIVAILAAVFSALFTLWANIRQRAWLVVYKEKRREIRSLLRTLDTFASTVVNACEVVALEKRPAVDQATSILYFIQTWFGPGAATTDPACRAIIEILPDVSRTLAKDPDALDRIKLARQALLNRLDSELMELNLRSGRLKTTLALTLRNPDLMARASDLMATTYAQIHSTKPAYLGFDADRFGRDWSRDMTPLKLALRYDLNRSSRSLGAAIRLSWSWRIKRTKLWKAIAGNSGSKAPGVAKPPEGQ